MRKDLNLEDAMSEITRSMAHKTAEMEDASVYAYLKGAIDLLSYAGKDITEYALIRVQNPMEYKNSGVAVSSQFRIVPIADLTNLPVYEE